ncbi:hypothetical protein [Streptomyces sp. ITFR-16]|uniref:hypothetical protein n=1 Tax=Streptomyces sp. ITFR-16 TaxID=3075198 RepID=UPI00288BF05C|nr:hypothetical protein [Streptomyces sp. ITFR-16]WNI27274.1 hypothetical protein RLT58_35645 [Streptomyces sp. ITFR-16]
MHGRPYGSIPAGRGHAFRKRHEGPGNVVFFSDVTLRLENQGRNWADFRAKCEAVIDELINIPAPQLYMTPADVEHQAVPVPEDVSTLLGQLRERLDADAPATRARAHEPDARTRLHRHARRY